MARSESLATLARRASEGLSRPSLALRARVGPVDVAEFPLRAIFENYTPLVVAKSIAHETTFVKDLEDPEVMRAWLLELSKQVGCRLRRHGLKGRTVHLKVRCEDFHTITRAQTLPQATNVTQEIWQAADAMFAERLPARRLHIRLLGVGMSGFDRPELTQLSLFPEAEHERQTRLDEVADRIKEKFGQVSLQRAFGMLHNVEHQSGPPGADRNQ